MSLAYVLLKCDNGNEKQVLDEIKTIREVKETQETFGPFGAVIKIESDNAGQIRQILKEQIYCYNGVNSSVVLEDPFDSNKKETMSTWEELRGLSWIFYEDC